MRHEVQPLAASAEKVPAEQMAQLEAPSAEAVVPAMQFEHPVALIEEANVPVVHALQFEDPEEAAKKPARQLEQIEAPAAE